MWVLGLGVLGAVIGSFLATIALRWPQERSVMHGRSACDGCGRTLRAHELIPLMSWLQARGRCRTCRTRIDPLHPIIEAGCVGVGIAAASVAPGPAALAGAAFGWLLLLLAVMDARDFWLPDPLVAALALVASAGTWVAPPALEERLIGGVGGFALLWSVGAGYRRWRGREGLGGGDPKLFGAIGLALGWRMLPAVLLVAGLVGLGWVLVQRVRGRTIAADDALPFGTLLAIAAYPAWLLMVGMAA